MKGSILILTKILKMVAPIWFSPVVYDYSSISTSLQTLGIFNKFLLHYWMSTIILMIFWTSLKTNEIELHSALMRESTCFLKKL